MSEPAIIRIASPRLDQARSIGRVIRNGKGRSVHLQGLILPEEIRPLARGPFDSFERVSSDALEQAIPTGGEATAALLKRGDIVLGSVTMTTPALRFYDKSWSLSVAQDCEVPIPQTWTSRDDDLHFPVFFKPATEGGLASRGLARSRVELPLVNGVIYQEYIDSIGTYGVGFIARRGKLVAAHIHYERVSFPKLGGSAVVIERIQNERLLQLAREIITQSDFSGWGLVEFKYCPRRDDFVFMEINAKFWASCIFAFRNEPEFARQLFGVEPTMTEAPRILFVHRALARGWRYVLTSLPGEIAGAEMGFGEGAWFLEAGKLVVPSSIARKLRGFLKQ